MSGPVAGPIVPMTEEQKQMVEDNKGLVYAVVNQMNQRQRDEKLQYGFLGLIHAAKHFDLTRDFKFSTYACNCIRMQITRGIQNDATLIHIPFGLQFNRSRKGKLKPKHPYENEAERCRRPFSLDAPSKYGHRFGDNIINYRLIPGETLEPENEERDEIIRLIPALMDSLDPVKYHIIHKIVFEKVSHTLLSKELGLSRKTIAMYFRKAIEKFREELGLPTATFGRGENGQFVKKYELKSTTCRNGHPWPKEPRRRLNGTRWCQQCADVINAKKREATYQRQKAKLTGQ